MTDSIFKVIQIIDEYSLIINGGLDHDLSLNDKIEIFIEGNEVKDPFEENKVLGTLDFIKERLTITEIYPEFSVCEKKVEKIIRTPSPLQKAIRDVTTTAFGQEHVETIIENKKLNVNEEEITNRVTGEKQIEVGDLARVVAE